jgi:hypothetical protein
VLVEVLRPRLLGQVLVRDSQLGGGLLSPEVEVLVDLAFDLRIEVRNRAFEEPNNVLKRKVQYIKTE